MTLKSFPRGGKKPFSKSSSSTLFNKKEKVKPRKNRVKKPELLQPGQEEIFVAKSADCLTYTTLSVGMVILGQVHSASQYNLSISLPGRLSGHLEVTDISESYTNLLKNLVQSQDNQSSDFKPLSDLYKRGDYIVCYVKKIDSEDRNRVQLSIDPELINQSLKPEKLNKNSKIACSINSVEDHGYVVDTGMQNLRGFLATKDVEEGAKYFPGQQVFCAVKNIKSSENTWTVKLSTKTKHTTSTVAFDEQPLDAVVPGTKLVLTVKEILKNGLHVTFNGNNVGYINQTYLEMPLDSYNSKSKIIGTLMYVMPTVKFAFFTQFSSDTNKEIIDSGEIIKNAKFLYRESNGLVLSLKKGVKGFVPFKRTDIDFDKIPSVFVPDSIHKCRVMTYDLMDQIHICTMQKYMLNKKFISAETVKIGDVLEVLIVQIHPRGTAFVKSGHILGDVSPEHLVDIDENAGKKPKAGDKVMARILEKNEKGNRFKFTLKKSLVESNLPILSDFNCAKQGDKYLGTIAIVSDDGLLIRFFGNVKGFLPAGFLDGLPGSTKKYSVGQVLLFKISFVKEGGRLIVNFADAVNNKGKKKKQPETAINFKIGQTVEGIIVDADVNGVYLKIETENGKDTVTGFLPAGHMSPDSEVGSSLSARCVPGDTLKALVFSTSPEFILTKTFIPLKENLSMKTIKKGLCVPISVKEIETDGIKVILPIEGIKTYGHVSKKDINGFLSLSIHTVLIGKISSIDKKEGTITLTTKLVQVLRASNHIDGLNVTSVDALAMYLSKLRELSKTEYFKSKKLSKLCLGHRVSGVVEKVTEHGLVLKLENDIAGIVRPSHFKGQFKVGTEVKGSVFWINHIHEVAEVTLLPTMANSLLKDQRNFKKKKVLNCQMEGEIIHVTSWFALVVLKGCGSGLITAIPVRKHINDRNPDYSTYIVGKKIRCYVVLDNYQNMLPICLLKSAFREVGTQDKATPTKSQLKRKINNESDDQDSVSPKKSKIIEEQSENVEEESMEVIENVDASKSKKTKRKIKEQANATVVKMLNKEVKNNDKEDEEVEEKEDEEKGEDEEEEEEEEEEVIEPMHPKIIFNKEENKSVEELGNTTIPDCGFFWDAKPDSTLNKKDDSSSSDDDDNANNEPKQKKKKLNAAERHEQERQREREIRDKEEALARNETPNSVDQFDRLVLASPDSSFVWLQYMAYHLQATEIEKARAVAKRALKTISFRDEDEKLNVWQAWLNMESRFGTPETLHNVFQEAVRSNDSKKIYLHMLIVHGDAGRQSELEKIVKTVTGKYKDEPQIWVDCGMAFLKLGLKEKSRHTMQRALQSLVNSEHVDLMVKFAQLENKFGDKERAQTLYEQILTSYPKRVNVWSSYVDSLVKGGDIETARSVLERAVMQTLPPKKMKTLFDKFIKFEEQHGTAENIERAKDFAVQYVNNQCKRPIV